MTKAEKMIAAYKENHPKSRQQINQSIGTINFTIPIVFIAGVIVGAILNK